MGFGFWVAGFGCVFGGFLGVGFWVGLGVLVVGCGWVDYRCFACLVIGLFCYFVCFVCYTWLYVLVLFWISVLIDGWVVFCDFLC